MKSSLFKFLILVGIIALGIVLGRFFNVTLDDVRSFFTQFPIIVSGIVFVLLYVVATTFILFGPKDILRTAAAFIFGPYVSTAFVWIGEVCNAVILFSISRSLGREYVQAKFNLKSETIEGVQHQGMSAFGIFVLRINPLIPFRLMDLSFGLSRVDLKKYISVCVIGSIPRIFWLQYIIHGVGANMFKDMASVQQYLLDNRAVLLYSLTYFLLIIVLSLAAFIASLIRKARLKKSASHNKGC